MTQWGIVGVDHHQFVMGARQADTLDGQLNLRPPAPPRRFCPIPIGVSLRSLPNGVVARPPNDSGYSTIAPSVRRRSDSLNSTGTSSTS